jgi:hypothetical protein
MSFLKKIIEFFHNPIVSADYKDGVMTIEYENQKVEQYSGDCTVWYKMPYMKRCGTSTESWLCELWKYNRTWGGPYPNAHETKSGSK